VAGGLTLDSGALIAAEKQSERFWKVWAVAVKRSAHVTIPTVVLAQAWRGNSPIIARLLQACDVEGLDEPRARRIGRLLAATRTRDVIDAAVVVGAVARGDAILTSDPDGIGRLVAGMDSTIPVLRL